VNVSSTISTRVPESVSANAISGTAQRVLSGTLTASAHGTARLYSQYRSEFRPR
jgi:hypothetical protein